MRTRTMTLGLMFLSALGLATPPSFAQVALPSLPSLPSLPATPAGVTDIPGNATRAIGGTVGALTQVRALQIQSLLRQHRDVIDTDADGAPVVRSEIIAIEPASAAIDAALAAGFSVTSEKDLDALSMRLLVLRAPSGMGTRKALKMLRRIDPVGNYEFNHLYLGSGSVVGATSTLPAAGGQLASIRVGLIDSGVDRKHPALAGIDLHSWGCDGAVIAAEHGTAVASLLVGSDGRSAGNSLYAADVYCGRATGGAVVDIVAAMAWLAKEQVGVINISLVGPANVLLERAIGELTRRGHILVAAVGNDGPAAPPLYPATYPGVVGVSAVNARDHVIPESGRGPQVDFAAPGADMVAADSKGGWMRVRGTSFASPLVARLLARDLPRPAVQQAASALAQLSATVIDAGAPGQDDIYGKGIVGNELRWAHAPTGKK